MITFISSELTGPVWRNIDLGAGASIEIAIRRPTLAEQLAALEETRGDSIQAFLLRSRIVDWRGVNDAEGHPVTFSWDALNRLCVNYSDAIWELLSTVRAAITSGDSDAKNCNSPPLAGGTETAVATAAMTESSACITTCAGSDDSALNSD